MKKLLLSLFTLTAFVVLADDFEKSRRDILDRQRNIIVNSDGCESMMFPKGKPVTVDRFYAHKLGKIKKEYADSVFWCCNTPMWFPCSIMPVFTGQVNSKTTFNGASEILKMNTTPLKLAAEYCRKEGLEFFVSFRMNDTHDAAWRPGRSGTLMSQYKLDRRHLLMGSYDKYQPHCLWSAWDYSHKEVRDHYFTVIKEALLYSNADGVEYDFMRHIQLFKSVARGNYASQAELEIMTQFMRDLRKMTEEVGRQRQRPVIVAVRLPDSLSYCRAVGVDLEKWMHEKLFDIYIGGAYFQLQPWENSVKLAHKYGIKFYPSLGGESRIQRLKNSLWIKGRNGMEYHAATASAAWAQGVDGLYFFNSDYAKNAAVLQQRIDLLPEKIRFANKAYYATERGSGSATPDTYLANGKSFFNNIPAFDPGNPPMIVPGNPLKFQIFVGDDIVEAQKAGKNVTVQIQLRSRDMASAIFPLSINGVKLAAPEVKGDIAIYSVPLTALKKGFNSFELNAQLLKTISSASASRMICKGNVLLQGKHQHPNRRIFMTDDLKQAEEIITLPDKRRCMRIADKTDKTGFAAGFVYPWNVNENNYLQVYFSMKLESCDTPGAVAVRIANNKYVEVVEFMPDEIRFRYSKRSVKFDTTKDFVNYRLRYLPDRKIFVLAQGKNTILTGKAVMTVDKAEGKIAEASQQVTNMHNNSFYYGSLAGKGTGSALWHNIKMVFPFVYADDFVLKINYK